MADTPIWTPNPTEAADSRIDHFRHYVIERTGRELGDYRALHSWSVEHPAEFWDAVWDFFGVVGTKGDVCVEPVALPNAVFFPEAQLNLAENILRSIPERDDADLPLVMFTGEAGSGIAVTQQCSREDMVALVAATAAALRERGVGVGDRVVLVLPVSLQGYVVMLAALSIGAVVSSASPEFGVPAIVDRFGQLDPVVLVAATSYQWAGKRYDRRDALVELAQSLPSLRSLLLVPGSDDPTSPVDPDVVDVTRIAALIAAGAGRGVRVEALGDVQRAHDGAAPCFEQLPFDHPAYVLFSSGTTGKPKCLIHRQGGALLKHLVEVGLHSDAGPGDRLMFYTTTGWMMWNWAASVPASGATLVLHDGAPHYPEVDGLFEVAARVDLTHLGLGARLLDSMRTSGKVLALQRDLSALSMVMVTGSPLTEATARWLVDELGPDVMPNPMSGGTDLIGGFLSGNRTEPVWAAEIPAPILGMDVDVFDEDGVPMSDETPGELVCRNTFPTVPLGIWGDASGERLRATYFERFPGVWTHGDLTSKTAHGGFIIHGRSDATLNVAGVRIGTGEVYSALEHIPDIVDSLVFAQEWDGDTRMVLLVVTAEGVQLDEELSVRIKATLRERCSPRHVPAVIIAVADLPRTVTGKLAEIAVRDIVAGRPVRNRDALANPDTLDIIAAAIPHT